MYAQLGNIFAVKYKQLVIVSRFLNHLIFVLNALLIDKQPSSCKKIFKKNKI